MVKKLFKHEFLFYTRVMTLIYAILLTVSAANRIIQLFANDTVAYTIVSVFSDVTYGVSVIAAFGFSFVMGIIRFYRNLFTAEGYLTFTLPATPRQHLLVKVVTAVGMNLLSVVMILISVCIVSAGELLKEIIIALRYIMEKLVELAGGHIPFYGLELLLLLLAAAFTGIMLYYTFISIGQLFKKNRILAAVGAYFVYYILTQVVSTVITIVFSILAENGAFEQIGAWILEHPFQSVHIGMWGAIVLSAIFALVEFLVVKWVITKKLNLE
ncbi:MAG: hypothetical protein IJZ15_02395 [Oscillospiraceae bacterium]|nr:hypothetical protein [Oscillospiraceae bacterium]